MKLKILIVSQYFWPEEFRVNDLASGLVALGHDVTVLTGLPNYPKGRFSPGYGFGGPWTEIREGIRIIRAPLTPRGSSSKLALIMNYASFAIAGSIVALLRCGKDYDAIFVYEVSPVTVGFPAMVVRARSKAPMFFWTLDLWPESLRAAGMMNSSLADSVAAFMARTIYASCDVILAPARDAIPSIRKTARQDRDIRYFPQWSEDLPTPDATHELPPLPDGFKVMFTGNVGASQDFETVLAAAEYARVRPDISWVVVGDGHRLPWVRAEIKRRGLETTVTCVGRYPFAAMPAFVERADALLATLKDEPVFAVTVPAKIQTYLAAGRPIVSAINGEVMRIVREAGAGEAVAAGDAKALAEAVIRIADLPKAEREAMGARGKAYFDAEYRRERLFDKLVEWFKAAAVARAGGRRR